MGHRVPYLAISVDSMETTVLTEQQYSNCIRSSRYQICHESMETHLGKSSFLATLYFHSSITALTVCDTEKIILPTPEKATNLGYGIWLKHATFKHPQTVGVVGNSHAALEPILKVNTTTQWNDWHKYVSLAVFIHNTSYHHSIRYYPSAILYGRDPIKPLDIRFSRKAMESVETNSDYVSILQDSMTTKFAENNLRLIILPAIQILL